MASLGELIGALISQIGKGRSQADIATLEVGKLYKDHPLLSGFPVPRLTLDEVVVDLKIAIATVPTPGRFITPKVKEEVLAQVKEIVNNIEKEPSFGTIKKEYSELQKVWKSTHEQIIQRVSEFIPDDVEVETKSIAYGIALIIRGYLTSTMLSPDAKVPLKKTQDFLNKDAPQIEIKLASQIQESILKILETQPPVKDRLDVLVTASDLQIIPPEKITTLKLTLRESDRVWTQIETEKGEIKEKLIPN
jgi:hypothetical protein